MRAVYFALVSGREPAKEWINGMKDPITRTKVFTRIRRAETGNFGDYKNVDSDVYEFRIFY